MNTATKVKIRWHNKVEKYATEEDKVQGKPEEVIEWDREDEISLEDALALGFQINQKEVTHHGNDPNR
jgi:hypothetical protein